MTNSAMYALARFALGARSRESSQSAPDQGYQS
jgi:hypothetical protein